MALGASRRRLVQNSARKRLLAEAGGAAGIVIAHWTTRLLAVLVRRCRPARVRAVADGAMFWRSR